MFFGLGAFRVNWAVSMGILGRLGAIMWTVVIILVGCGAGLVRVIAILRALGVITIKLEYSVCILTWCWFVPAACLILMRDRVIKVLIVLLIGTGYRTCYWSVPSVLINELLVLMTFIMLNFLGNDWLRVLYSLRGPMIRRILTLRHLVLSVVLAGVVLVQETPGRGEKLVEHVTGIVISCSVCL